MKNQNKVAMAIINANTEADLSLLNFAEALLFAEMMACNDEQGQSNLIEVDILAEAEAVTYDI